MRSEGEMFPGMMRKAGAVVLRSLLLLLTCSMFSAIGQPVGVKSERIDLGPQGPTLSPALAETLALTPEQTKAVNDALRTAHPYYTAMESKCVKVKQIDANHIEVTAPIFGEEMKTMKEMLWSQIDAALDEEQRAVARKHLPLDELFPFGEFETTIEISFDGQYHCKETRKTAAGETRYNSSFSGTLLPPNYERYWKRGAKTTAPLPKPAAHADRRESLSFGPDGPVLTRGFIEMLRLDLPKIEAVNEVLRASYQKYLDVERQHVQKEGDAKSGIRLTIAPFTKEWTQLQTDLWAELDRLLDERQRAVMRRHLPLEDLFPYGNAATIVDIQRAEKNFRVREERSSLFGLSNSSSTTTSPTLPSKVKRFWPETQEPGK